MDKAICCACLEDRSLREIVADEGEIIPCSVCEETENPAITVARLGELLEPILREHFEPGPIVKKFGDNDAEWSEQEGDPISHAIQEVLGQYFEFEDEIVDAVVDAESYSPGDGAYWDRTNSYVSKRIQLGHFYADWNYTLDELKHSRRFFSPAAQALFTALFDGVEDLKVRTGSRHLPVVRILPPGTKLFRARVCTSRQVLKEIWADPLKHAGPPSSDLAQAGRMNAAGVAVFYGARDGNTCMAEVRPVLGNELALIELETTQPLRILDFTRLENAHGGASLSYFQSDFSFEVERSAFLRKLHRLISQPVVPGHEADYLITQTMSENLAHMHARPFNGIFFTSAQRVTGVNVVLFPDTAMLAGQPAQEFSLKYVEGSVRLFSTKTIRYQHRETNIFASDDGELWISGAGNDEFDDD